MQNKLNEEFIDSYCEKFATKVTSSFFVDGKESITGKEILSVTPSKQVNYFVIKLLFRYWQAETKKLESPFFNYKHTEVKQALIEFMNVLSQHIEVHKSKFELLLNHATKDTLYLAAAPDAYIEIDLEGRGIDRINEKAIAGTLKYLRIYKKEIHDFLSDMQGLTIDDVIDEVGPEFELFDSMEGLSHEVELLNSILPIKIDQVVTPFDQIVDDFDDFDDDDLFERGEEDLIETQKKEEIKEVATKVEQPKEVAVPLVKTEETATEKEEHIPKFREPVYKEPEDLDLSTDNINWGDEEIDEERMTPKKGEIMEEEIDEDDTPEQTIVETPPAKESEVEEKNEVLQTINEQFEKPQETVAEHHENKPEDNLMTAISVNQQYMFQKELFKDDPVSFQNALLELDDYNSFDDAVEFLVQSYAKEFNWDMQSVEVKELLKVLFRKFRD